MVKEATSSSDRMPRAERKPLNVSVQFNGPYGPNQGKTLNLSRGGMFIHTKQPGVVGERIFFQLQPDERAPIRFNVEGVVVWTRKRTSRHTNVPKGMGIRFTINSTQTHQTIDGIFSMLNQLQS